MLIYYFPLFIKLLSQKNYNLIINQIHIHQVFLINVFAAANIQSQHRGCQVNPQLIEN